MKHACIFLAAIVCIYTAHAQSGIDTLIVQQDADTVHIFNNNIPATCGASFAISASISGDSISILESDTSSMHYRCPCSFDASVTISGLSPGTYCAFVFRKNWSPPDDTTYIGSVPFTIQPGGSPLLNISSNASACHTSGPTSVETSEAIKSFSMIGNYPNPFNPTTIIRYQIHQRTRVKLEIFDEVGRLITTLVDEEKSLGDYEIPWNASTLPSGIYLCKLTAGNEIQTQKMTLLK